MHWAVHLAAFQEAINEMMGGNAQQRFSTRDILIAVTASLLVGTFLFLWISLHYRRRAERDGSRRVLMDTPAPKKEHGDRRRRRRRRRPHRPRNPSLHQTGGLPPPRPEEQPPKF
jgi:hypothetical protein